MSEERKTFVTLTFASGKMHNALDGFSHLVCHKLKKKWKKNMFKCVLSFFLQDEKKFKTLQI